MNILKSSSKAGADHISAQCEAFIKEEVMVK
jgi:hypothetical protein